MRLLHLLEPRDARLHLADLLGLLLRRLGRGLAAVLSLSGLLLIALRTPCELHSRWVRARARGLAGGGVLRVGLAGVAPGDGALLEEGVVAAVEDRHLALGEVELDDAGDRARQELTVVGDEDDAAA